MERTERRPIARWVVGALVATLGLAVLAGCSSTQATGSSAGTQTGAGAVLTAYTQTVAAGSARISLDENVSTGGTNRTISADGRIDFASQNLAMDLTIPSLGSLSIRVIPPELYLQAPGALQSELPPGKSWLSIDLDTLTTSQYGASLSELSDSSQQSTQILSYLEAVSSNGITEVGPATIRGVPTTEYRATVDLTKAAALKDARAQAALQRIESELHTTSFPVQVWLDDQGRVAQMSYQITVPASSATSSATSVSITVGFYDFGTPVTVTAPPASQVYDITNQVLGAGASATS
ncbi:MAG: hypothetical protein ACLQPH_02260 [Acidimicrobiales bacterium]